MRQSAGAGLLRKTQHYFAFPAFPSHYSLRINVRQFTMPQFQERIYSSLQSHRNRTIPV